jgi:biopolymer transport protein ExbD
MQTKTVALAPFVSLFLILTVIFAATAGTSKGLHVGIAYRPKDCGDGQIVVAHVLQNGSVRLNQEQEIKRNALAKRLHEIFATTAERLLFIKADPDLAFQTVAEIIDIAQSQVDYVGILTPAVENEPGLCLSIGFLRFTDAPTVLRLKDVPLWPWW